MHVSVILCVCIFDLEHWYIHLWNNVLVTGWTLYISNSGHEDKSPLVVYSISRLPVSCVFILFLFCFPHSGVCDQKTCIAICPSFKCAQSHFFIITIIMVSFSYRTHIHHLQIHMFIFNLERVAKLWNMITFLVPLHNILHQHKDISIDAILCKQTFFVGHVFLTACLHFQSGKGC